MKKNLWQIILGVILIALSAAVYLVHYFIFRDVHHIFIYLVGDVAFVGIEVLLVTLVMHRLLAMREKRQKLDKLNMVIGTFFSEVGTKLLAFLSDRDPQLDILRRDLVVKPEWSPRDFAEAARDTRGFKYEVELTSGDFAQLKKFLLDRRDFMLRLLENPNLLEHESFTELLRAAFHLAEELDNREGFDGQPDSDVMHLRIDGRRVYTQLVREWLAYMRYLKDSYPHLFSLAVRTNPFDREASVIVT